MFNSALLQLPALEALVDCLQRRARSVNFEREPIFRLATAHRRLAAALPAYGRYTLFEWVQASLMGALIYRTKIDEMYGSNVEYRTPDDKLHRDGDRPAVELANGYRGWYKNGKLHRDGDRPAVEAASGYRAWYKNGEQHRDGDRPAVEWVSGTRSWYKNGKRHRDGDRPAVEWADGYRQWWRDGVKYTPAGE